MAQSLHAFVGQRPLQELTQLMVEGYDLVFSTRNLVVWFTCEQQPGGPVTALYIFAYGEQVYQDQHSNLQSLLYRQFCWDLSRFHLWPRGIETSHEKIRFLSSTGPD